MKPADEERARRYRDKAFPATIAAKVLNEFHPSPPTNLEDLSLRLRIPQEDLKAILHWLIDSGFMKRSVHLPGFKFYPRKRAKQVELDLAPAPAPTPATPDVHMENALFLGDASKEPDADE